MANTDGKYENPPLPQEPKVSPPRTVSGTILKVLGCGTSSGVPLLACRCKVCSSKDPRNSRTRASVVIQTKNRVFLIDTSPDLRHQAFQNKIHWIDAVLYTHPHADHIHGVDELRSFNFVMARRIPVYGNEWTIEALTTKFDYIFKITQAGGGKPQIDPHVIKKTTKIAGVKVQPLELIHGKLPVLGYRINDIAYITDCSYIPDQTFRYLKNLKVLVLDCLRPKEHPTHLHVEAALELAKRIGAKRTFFTHMGHELDYKDFLRSLPSGMQPAYDGLVIKA